MWKIGPKIFPSLRIETYYSTSAYTAYKYRLTSTPLTPFILSHDVFTHQIQVCGGK